MPLIISILKPETKTFISFLVLIITFSTVNAQELLMNDFENQDSYEKLNHYDVIEDWQLIFWDNMGYGYGEVDSTVAYRGENSLKLVCDSADFQSAARIHLNNVLSFNTGDSITFTFYAKSQSDSFKLVNRFLTEIRTDSAVFITPEFSMYKFHHTFSSDISDFNIWIMLGNNTGNIWIDNISLSVYNNHNASVYHVSPAGDDFNPGSLSQPLKTITKAVSYMDPGNTCYIHEGNYPETVVLNKSGTIINPITFKAYKNSKVVIDGRNKITDLDWQKESSDIWSAIVTEDYHQLLIRNDAMVFSKDTPFVEARWPNMKFHENWIEGKKWAMMEESSTYGIAKSQEFANTGISLEGGTIHMKYVENFFGSCRISSHVPGSSTIYYEKIAGFGDPDDNDYFTGKGHYDRRFYVTGVLALLDNEEEWFYDSTSYKLYVKTPGNVIPSELDLSVKVREYGMVSDRVDHINIENIDFFATSIQLGWKLDKMKNEGSGENFCRNIVIRDCKFLYPNHDRFVEVVPGDDEKKYLISDAWPFINAQNALLENCEIGWAVNRGLEVFGRGNTIQNCVVHNTSLNGIMIESGMKLLYGYYSPFTIDSANTITHCTSYNSGGVALVHHGPGPNNILYNHLFNAGIYSGDITAHYLPYAKNAGGTVIAHNWVHNLKNGGGMRVDSWGIDISFHHNVVWNCNSGVKLQGPGPWHIYNNTIFVNKGNTLALTIWKQEWNSGEYSSDQSYYQLFLDNSNVMNNISYNLYYRDFANGHYYYKYHENEHFTTNYTLNEPVDEFMSTKPGTIDLRPSTGSEIIDKGIFIDGITDDAIGKPDLGAYEYGGKYWYPGADWLRDSFPVPETMKDATMLAEFLSKSPVESGEKLWENLSKTAFPVPENGAIDVPVNQVLKFIHGYKSVGADVYFGTDSMAVATATQESPEFLMNISIPENNVVLKDSGQNLEPRTKYYWRTDAIDENGKAAKGDIWYFTTGLQTYTVKLQIYKAGSEETIVSRVRVHYNDKTIFSNLDGVADLGQLVSGNLYVSIIHDDYFTLEDSFMITSDTAIQVYLTDKFANITFLVTDSLTSIENAKITINDNIYYTDDNGKFIYYNHPAREEYIYQIIRDGYLTVSDTIYLEVDTIVNIQLQLNTKIHNLGIKEINVYPNPAGTYITIELPQNIQLYNIELTDILGKLHVKKRMVFNHENLDVSDLIEGLYILKISTSEITAYKKIIIQR